MNMHPKRMLAACVFLFGISVPLAAQKSQGEYAGTMSVGSVAVTRTTAEIMQQQSRLPLVVTVRRPPEHEVDRENLAQNPASPDVASWPARSSSPDKSLRGFTPFTPQTVSTSFTGATLAETGAFPPDVMGDVGPTQYIVDVNGLIRSFNKTTGIADGALNANTDVFFSSVMTSNNTNFTSDPRIRYDRLTKRWIAIMIDVPGGKGALANRVMIAVSDSATITPSSVWSFFFFTPSASAFADYPTLGVDANALYIGCNMFTLSGSYNGTNGYVVQKGSILGAGPIVVTSFLSLATPTGSGPYTPQGVDNLDTASTFGYFIGCDNLSYGLLQVRRITNPGGTPTISSNISLTVSTTDAPRTVPHLGNTGGNNGFLDAIDDRLFMAVQRNGSLWTVQNIEVSNGGTTTSPTRNGIRWYEINNLATTPAVVQSGTIYDATSPNDTLRRNYWMPSIMVSGQGHVALGFSTAGTGEHANAATVGRLASDATGTMQTPLLYTSSASAYNPASDPGGTSGRRWGDYTYTSVDPDDDMTMWTAAEFCDTTNSYGVRVVKLVAPPPATPVSCVPSSAGTGAMTNVVVTGSSVSGSGFFDPGPNFARHISAAVSGTGVTVNSVTYTSPTSVTLNLSVAANATTGGRTITVTNPDGQAVASASNIFTVSNVQCGTITVSPATLPAGAAGSPYSHQIAASGGTSPYTFSVTAGSLPQNLTLTTAGLLSGTPTFGGTYNFTITGVDSNGCSGNQAYSWTVTGCPQITLAPTSLAGGTVGVPYSQSVTASGGTSPYTYSISAGTLPNGLTLSTGGAISGTPSASGTSNFTVQATDASACTGSRAYSISIAGGTTIILAAAGSAYTQDFNTLASSGSAGFSTLPTGWLASESGSNADTTYAAGTGSSTTGNTYSFGAASNTERALGGLQSGTLNPTFGAVITNATGTTITSLLISYTGEQWRLGNTGRTDTIQFQLSTTATSLTSGAYTSYNQLNFKSPVTTGTTGALDGNAAANRTAVSATLSGLSIANGSTFYIRWNDFNATGADDGLAVDDFSITPNPSSSTNPTGVASTTLSSVYPTQKSLIRVVVTPGTGPASTGLAVAGDLSAIGGSPSQTFYDDGTHGDLTPADNTFSYLATIAGGTSAGVKSLPIVVSDAQARSSNTNAGLTILACQALSVTPASLPSGTAYAAFSQQLSVTNGVAPYAFALNSGSLPSSVSLSPSGLISGTPLAKGTFPVTIGVTDSVGCTGSVAETLRVNCPSVTVTTHSLPSATVGSAYAQSFSVAGGHPPYAYSVSSGLLPSGVSLSPAGALNGTPSQAGSFIFQVGVSDSLGCTGISAETLAVVCPSIVVSPATLVPTQLDSSYNLQFTAAGGTSPYNFSVGSGALPTGITLSTGGLLSGTALTGGVFAFTVSVSDSFGCGGSRPETLTVQCSPVTITTSSLPTAIAGSSYLTSLSASGGHPPYAFSLTSGALPAGIALHASGLVDGTPTAVGTFHFVAGVIDSSGCESSRAESLVVQCPVITASSGTLPVATAGSAYTHQLSAAGGIGLHTFVISAGSLPSGLSLSVGGLLSGTPRQTGSFEFRITASDSNGCAGFGYDTLAVTCPTIAVSPSLLGHGMQNEAYAESLHASGGWPPYLFAISGGSLPPGISLSPGGEIAGTPPQADSTSFQVTVTDSIGCATQVGFSLVVDSATTISLSVGVASQWNMISTPVVGTNDSTTHLFPTALGQAFAYDAGAGYAITARLSPLAGYWLRFGSSQNLVLSGTSITEDSIVVADGWNMIGAYSQAVSVGAMIGAGTSTTSSYFGYDGGYFATDSLRPGLGYWIKCTGAGAIVRSHAGAGISTSVAIIQPPEHATRFVLADAAGNHRTLYLQAGNTNLRNAYELPPLPPEGLFDVRFASNSSVAGYDTVKPLSVFSVRTQTLHPPLELRWNIAGNDRYAVGPHRGLLKSLEGASGSMVLTPTADGSFEIDVRPAGSLPDEYRLLDVYPNPFNPSTTIEYDLPKSSEVKLSIVNLLGQTIRTLVQSPQDGGHHAIQWDGVSNWGDAAGSGVYFVRIEARASVGQGDGHFSATKKIVLMR